MLQLNRTRSIVVSLATVAGAIYLSADSEPLASTVEHGSKLVRVAAVEAAADHRELRFSGVTRAARRARLAFSIGGRLVDRPVELGDSVKKGQVLAWLDDREPKNAVAMARGVLAEVEARRAQMERDVERLRGLVEAKAATGEELERSRSGLDAARAAQEAAQARWRETERMLGEGRLEAPFAGAVTEVFFEPGEYVGPGHPVVVLSGDGDLELEVEVPESVVPRIEAGSEVDVVVPLAGRTVRAHIDSVGRTAAGPGRLFPVTATIPAARDLVAGATAELVLELESDDALAVPVEAVVNPGGRRPAVFRIVDAAGETQVEKIFVEVGSLLGAQVTVRSASYGPNGLRDASRRLGVGDRVVVGGQRGLLDGETVQVDDDARIANR